MADWLTHKVTWCDLLQSRGWEEMWILGASISLQPSTGTNYLNQPPLSLELAENLWSSTLLPFPLIPSLFHPLKGLHDKGSKGMNWLTGAWAKKDPTQNIWAVMSHCIIILFPCFDLKGLCKEKVSRGSPSVLLCHPFNSWVSNLAIKGAKWALGCRAPASGSVELHWR